MSAASKAREKAKFLKSMEDRYGPFPDPGTTPPPLAEQDPELARLIGWFCQNRKEIAEELDVAKIYVSDADGTLCVPKPKPPSAKVATALAMASAIIGG